MNTTLPLALLLLNETHNLYFKLKALHNQKIKAPWRKGNAEWFLFIIVPTC
jgi:hypothetical protein